MDRFNIIWQCKKDIQAILIRNIVYMHNGVNWPASLLVHFLNRRLFRLVLFHAHQFTQHARIFWPAGELCWELLSFFIVKALVLIVTRLIIRPCLF